MDARDFYNAIAAEYDDVVDTQAREQAAGVVVDRLLDHHTVRSAVDVACGTGLFTRALARRGVRAIGVDISEDMLALARSHAEVAGLDIRWVCSDMQSLPTHLGAPHDALLCMGNSLPHLLEADELDAAMRAFASVLRPGSCVLLHVLNYVRILQTREQEIGRRHIDGREYARRQVFENDHIWMELVEVAPGEDEGRPVRRVCLRPWTREQLEAALERAGFGSVTAWGGPRGEPFDEAVSDVLFLQAVRAGQR